MYHLYGEIDTIQKQPQRTSGHCYGLRSKNLHWHLTLMSLYYSPALRVFQACQRFLYFPDLPVKASSILKVKNAILHGPFQ